MTRRLLRTNSLSVRRRNVPISTIQRVAGSPAGMRIAKRKRTHEFGIGKRVW